MKKRITVCAVFALSLTHSLVLLGQGDPPQRLAREAVERALKIEVAGGSISERAEALEEALKIDKNFAPAHWHRGELFENGKWRTIDEASKKHAAHPYLRAYEKKRRETRDTEEGNWEIATWCEPRAMWQQKHAHLCRVLELNPKNETARLALGWRKTSTGWISAEQVFADVLLAIEEKQSLYKYREKIRKALHKLSSANVELVDDGRKELQNLANAESVVAIEKILSGSTEDLALHAVMLIGAIRHPAATRSLVRHAIYHDSTKVRDNAADELAKRDPHGWVPSVLALLRNPIEVQSTVQFASSGEVLGIRHFFQQENRNTKDSIVMDTSYDRHVQTYVGDVQTSLSVRGTNFNVPARVVDEEYFNYLAYLRDNYYEQLFQEFRLRILTNISLAAASNATTYQNTLAANLNERASYALDKLSEGKKIGSTPDDYWKWWNARKYWGYSSTRVPNNEYYYSTITDVRPVYASYHFDRQVFYSSCLVGATKVASQRGSIPVKDIRIGDLVYTKDIHTGRLQLAPVVQVTNTNAEVDLIRFVAGAETIESSKGHEFFVVGKGWTKACDMKVGDLLHGAAAPTKIESVVESGKARVYNLVVANFANYFVGEGNILSHDLTERAENYYLVPGLAPQAR